MKVRKNPYSTNYYTKNKISCRKRYYEFKKNNPEKISIYSETYRAKINKMLEHLPTQKEDDINLLSESFILSLIKKLYEI